MDEKLIENYHPLQKYYSRIYRSYDLVNSLFTFGLDKKWRTYTVRECLKLMPGSVLDLCCGTGDIAIALSSEASHSINVTGYDLNDEMIGIARQKAEKARVMPEFIRGDAFAMPFKNEQFDCITIGFGFRNLTWENPLRDRYISEICRVLRTGGSLFILESSQPEEPLLRWFYKLYLKYVLIPLGGIVSGDWNAYRYLAGSSNAFYKFIELKNILGRYNLNLTLKKKFMAGSANLLIAKKLTG